MGLCAGIYIDGATSLRVMFVFFNLRWYIDYASFNYDSAREYVSKIETDVECFYSNFPKFSQNSFSLVLL